LKPNLYLQSVKDDDVLIIVNHSIAYDDFSFNSGVKGTSLKLLKYWIP